MADIPEKLQELLEDFDWIEDRMERQQYLIEIADRFKNVKVPESIAVQPYDEAHRVPGCESEAFVWWEENEDGTLKYWFDVLNPHGLSAMAMAVVMDETMSGAPLDQVAAVDAGIVFKLFGNNISMGKGRGLTNLVTMVQHEAKERLK